MMLQIPSIFSGLSTVMISQVYHQQCIFYTFLQIYFERKFSVRSYGVYIVYRLVKILVYMINQDCCFSTVRHDTGSTGSCRKFPGRKEVFPLFLRVLAFTDNSIALTPSLFVSTERLVFKTIRNSKQGAINIVQSIVLPYSYQQLF